MRNVEAWQDGVPGGARGMTLRAAANAILPAHHPEGAMRRGLTLLELTLVLALLSVLLAIAVPSAARMLDRAAVSAAVLVLSGAFMEARDIAIATQRPVAVRLGPAHRVHVVAGGDTLLARDLHHAHGVTLTATRDSMTYASDGLAYGVANLSAIVRRGAVVDTVVVSRLGRVRYAAR